MKPPFISLLTALLSCLFTFSTQAAPKEFKTVLFEDDFSGPELKKDWGSWKSKSLVRNGILVGITPKTADHPSVNTIKLSPQSDLEVSVSFKFAGSKRFSIMFRDLDYKGSHAGHICHAAVSDQGITLYDGKTGQFRIDIRDKRKAGIKLDEATLKLIKEKTSVNKFKIDPTKWHDLRIRIEGNTITSFIDGKKAGSLTSEGIGHKTKSNMNITTVNREVHYDNFAIKAP